MRPPALWDIRPQHLDEAVTVGALVLVAQADGMADFVDDVAQLGHPIAEAEVDVGHAARVALSPA